MREPKYILSGESGIRTQRKWWNRNGRHFPIMKLPLEMRNIIYQHVLGGNMYPDTSSTGAVRFSGEFAKTSDHKAGSRAWRPDGKIFLVSKQVRQEAWKAAWEGTWKHFITSGNFEAVVQSSNPPSGFNWLTHIQLNLEQNEWFRLFGIAIDPFLHAIDAPRALLLGSIPTLKALEMYFPDPHSLPALVNSWKEYIWDNEHQDWFKNDLKYKGMRDVPCYNVITDWIILFGFPFIKHIPNVLLRGFIKPRMRMKWSRILDVEYRERKYDYRSHGFDYEQTIRSLEHWPVFA
ncbi:hypothetical protein BS50DRAFT_185978 [Corynespora cassiicola Philippines]|uniref:Uncharacterized protein n=1 Tax=Corynespora cassiicola Philippines TaxID=1448308 RepID=A0A2T2P784_CORCC|nr:hypothetical protein BS50DRAFT_185978 [Corynespora cassiicola Philippines]